MASPWKSAWTLRPGVTYLNHGSFGPSPHAVREAQRRWSDELESDPMDFFVHRLERCLAETRDRLAKFVGCAAADLLLLDNATVAMNLVARAVELRAGDEVLLTDHEYGAVERIWRTTCERVGARVVIQPLPLPLEDPDEVVRALFAGVTDRTRLVVFSHISSPTAVILPARQICAEARRRELPVCIDGPHAVAMLPLELRELDCDFYCASCHKWLSAPFGSGFCYVHPRRRATIQPLAISWGETPGGTPSWQGEFDWMGTRDPSANLSIPAAIDFLERDVGLEAFRSSTHALAQYARGQLLQLGRQPPLTADDLGWYGSMVSVPIAPGDAHALQERLWHEHRIEALVKSWQGRRLVRVSCHLYNDERDVERLLDALRRIEREPR
ncbi:MAG: aminotransferase class V-fold PLP-dependent enzyme [Planctomycetaceae bacterium]|nr:aminotransferase class V-fold PLP-dependent enzyme [Planctomycetaceae bacterium]